MADPIASLPRSIGYDDYFGQGSGPMPWSRAESQLGTCRNYFLCTANSEGRPHVMPVWALWMDDLLYFSTGANSRKASNFRANPEAVMTTDSADNPVIIEGRVETVTDAATVSRFLAAYTAKYDWPMEESMGPFYALRPRVAFGMMESPGEQGSPTRWEFPSSERVAHTL